MTSNQSTPPSVTAAAAAPGQRYLWLFDRYVQHDGTYNISFALRLAGPIDVQALNASLRSVVARHEVLRTRFALQDDELLQIIEEAWDLYLGVVDLSPDADLNHRLREDAARAFDLTTGPLLRATLYRDAPSTGVLSVVVHHIVFDGWSLGVFLQELAAGYEAYASGREPDLPALPIQYADYAEWYRDHVRSPEAVAGLDYWRDALNGVPRRIALPVDHPRGVATGRQGRLLRRKVDAHVRTALMSLARQERVTLHTVLMAAFGVLLSRYSGQDDLLLGTPVAGRSREELEPLIGFFVKTLPIRIRLEGDPSFRELLARIAPAVLDAIHHQDTPLDDINQVVASGGQAGAFPVMQVMLALQSATPEMKRFGGLDVSLFSEHNGTAKYDLFLNAVDESAGLRYELEYDTALFSESAAERLLDGFEQILVQAVQSPSAAVSRLDVLSPADRSMIDAANDTAIRYPSEATVVSLFERQVERTPDSTAVVCGYERVTYAELNRRANRLASGLRRSGARPGQVVGVALERSVDLVVSLLAILKVGAAYLPVDMSHPPDRIAFMLEDAAAALVVTTASSADLLGLPDAARVLIDRLPAANVDDEVTVSSAAGPMSQAYVMYTSGSTGRPKGVVIPHRGIVRLVCGQSYVDWSLVQAVLHMAPPAFDASTFEIWGPLLNGKRVVIYPDRELDLHALGDVIAREDVDCVWLTAALFNLIVDSRPGVLSGVSQLLAGGETLSIAHVRRAQRELPRTQFINGYGPTECTTFACCYRIPRPLPENVTSIPIGQPIAQTQARVLDAAGHQVPIGVVGELYIGGDGLALGYLNLPDLTAERFRPDPFSAEPGARLYRTGDRVRWLRDGTLEFHGRLDRQVKIRGFRIELDEIESALAQVPGVGQAAVALVEEVGDRRLVGYVAPQAGATLAIDMLRGALAVRLPSYMIPSTFAIVDQLPVTSNGKIDRSALPVLNRLGERLPAASPQPPSTALERQLVDLWAATLGVSPTSVADNFFELGGHSLRAIQLVSRMKEVLGVDWPFGRLLQHPTIADMARAIERDRDGSSPAAAITPLRTTGSRVPIFFTHGVGGEVWSFAALTEHLGEDQPVYGLLPPPPREGSPPSLSEMAARYVDEVMRLVPDGPYLLAGHCSGAAVAFEMAHQFSAAGRRVGLVAVLDYTFDEVTRAPMPWGLIDMARNFPLWLGDDLLQVGWRAVAGRVTSRWRLLTSSLRRRIVPERSPAPDIRDRLGMWRFPAHQAATLEEAFQTFRRHVPRPLVGDVLLIKPRALPLLTPRLPEDLGWSKLVKGRLTIQTIKGSHDTMLREPFVQDLAAVLRAEFDRALAKAGQTG